MVVVLSLYAPDRRLPSDCHFGKFQEVVNRAARCCHFAALAEFIDWLRLSVAEQQFRSTLCPCAVWQHASETIPDQKHCGGGR